jgi:hypothetical protein
MHREIPRFVECPPLNPELRSLITRLVYLPNYPPTPSDSIFVFGNRNFSDTAATVQQLIDSQISGHIIISGGSPKFDDNSPPPSRSESESISSLLNISDPLVHVSLEQAATNTRENVINSLNLFPPSLNSLTYVCLWYLSCRARLSLRKFLPESVRLFQYALPKKEPDSGIIIDPDTWYTSEIGRNRTFAEYLRIKTYAERGDIFSDVTLQNLIQKINSRI